MTPESRQDVHFDLRLKRSVHGFEIISSTMNELLDVLKNTLNTKGKKTRMDVRCREGDLLMEKKLNHSWPSFLPIVATQYTYLWLWCKWPESIRGTLVCSERPPPLQKTTA